MAKPPRVTAKHSKTAKHRSFLKWAGGKFRVMDEINRLLPKRKSCLVEPFVGAGSVFLNTHFERYILADINPDLINLFNIVKADVDVYIKALKPIFFHPDANSAAYYYARRDEFNRSQDIFERSVLFVYLNRFGFNGLCRYNARNEFNVPFGSYKTHYFPEAELRFFAQKAQSAVFICQDFHRTFEMVDEHCAVYCDPPYAPLMQDSNFTHYAGTGFSLEDQKALAELAQKSSQIVLISNHDTKFTREIYRDAKCRKLRVQRSISQTPQKRLKVSELIAVFTPTHSSR